VRDLQILRHEAIFWPVSHLTRVKGSPYTFYFWGVSFGLRSPVKTFQAFDVFHWGTVPGYIFDW